MFIDTHCHLDFPEFNSDRDEALARSVSSGVGYIINVGSSLENSIASVELAAKYRNIYASVGVHPHDADTFDKKTYVSIKALAKQPKVTAIGEIGLDYYRNYSDTQNQRRVFISLLSLAKELSLPVILHTRQAEADTLSILKEAGSLRVVVHCFSGGEDFLREALDLGFFVSFTCNITYKKAQSLRGIIKITPLERIFLETDAPYLSPEGLRGQRNEPRNVLRAAEIVAGIKNISVQEVGQVTTGNAKAFFNIK